MGISISQEQKNIFAQNLNRLLQENNKTQTDLVNHFKLTASTVSDWCNAKKYPRVDKVQMLADYFNVRKSDLTELNFHEDIKNELLKAINNKDKSWARVMPVYQSIEFNNDGYELKDFIRHVHIDDIEDFENHICLLIPNNDLEPEFTSNDIALIRKQNNIENNKYFYIIKNSNAMIRKITLNNDDKTLVLKADNPNTNLIFAQKDELKIIGKVIALQKNKKLE